ncbi:MAG: hypothetical protein HY014_15130, partial [Acidobacteria bacterium]|nr:hypothetical protein [Acidobacteriota bacterium]
DEVTQQNAALVEESAAAAESLDAQAHALTDIVSRFKTGVDVRRAQPARSHAQGPSHRKPAPAARAAVKGSPARPEIAQTKPRVPTPAGDEDGSWEAF